MANRNLQVNLSFKADTSAALKNLETLRSSLNSISSMPFQGGKVITADIRQAAAAAEQLQHHLGMAMDVKTGNLNLNKLQASLASSNTSLASLTGNLLKAGTTGQQAFLATHRAISNANLQLTKSNTLLSQFTTTLFSAAKWQAAYGAINMVTQSMGKAVDYAKELDKSLNNISIVTGYSAEKMATFAKQANESAKALNTTTTKYTDASLIYFQQGLGDKEVKERTDITVKLANVVGESAEQVSEWTTAIWNNFAKGGESLESYADKLAALGAATASSADEIAQGLEKFSAVADTVGLSYDYATAALATVTAETRQSADVVGTAFKTLFARMEGLKLGETLDDGTTLNQYSQALMSVGINIKESNGNLKEMDTILDEMGSKWQDLGKDQQVALAQSVGGTRQYNQLIALMDNWDKFQENLIIAQTAEGTLSTQAEIYAESWQAAQDNIKASREGMYNTLIPKDFIIDFTNGLADVVDGFNKVLDAAGGLPSILLAISSIVMSKLQPQMTAMFNNIIGGFSKAGAVINGMFTDFRGTVKNVATAQFGGRVVKTSQAMANRTDMQKEVMSSTQNAFNTPGISESFKTQLIYQQEIEKHSMNLANIQGKISAAEHSRIQASIKELEALQDQTVELTKQKEKADEILATKMKSSKIMRKGVEDEYDVTGYDQKTGRASQYGLGKQKTSMRMDKNSASNVASILQNIGGASNVEMGMLRESRGQELKNVQTQRGRVYKEVTALEKTVSQEEKEFNTLKNKETLTTKKQTRLKELESHRSDLSSKSQKLNDLRAREAAIRNEVFEGKADFTSVESAQQGARAIVQHGADLVEITSKLQLKAVDLKNALEPIDTEIVEIKAAAEKDKADIDADKNLTQEEKNSKKAEIDKKFKEDIADLNKKREKLIAKAQQESDKEIDKAFGKGKLTKEEAEGYKKINHEIEDTTESLKKYEKLQDTSLEDTKAAGELVGVQGEAYDEVVDGAKKSAKAAADLHGNQQRVEHSSKKVSDNFETLKKSMSTIGAGLGQMTQGAVQAAMGFNMIISSIQQMKEEGTLTLSGISSLLMGITMGVPGFLSVLSGLKTILDVNRFSILANAAALTEENQAQIANTIAKTFGITTETALTVAKQIQEASTKKLTKAKLADILATNELSLSNVGLAITTWMVNAPALVLLATLISLIAVVALLVVGIKALINWYNQDAIAAEKAAKNAEILGQKYEKTKQAYEDLKTSIENIGSAQDTINSMIEGTEAWEKAVQDLNFQILELIREYPELIKYVDRIGGRLSIDKNGLEDFQEEQYFMMLKEFNTKTLADYSSKAMAGNENQTTLSRNFIKYDAKSVALSTGLLSLMNPFLTSIGLIKEFISEKQSEDSLVLAISALEKDMEEAEGALFDSSYKFEDWVAEYSGGNEAVKAALIKHEESILENVQSQVENTLALQELSATLLKNANEGNKFYDNSKYQEYIDSYYGKGAGKEEIKARVKEKYSEMSDEELAVEYAKMLYGENSRIKHAGGNSFTIEYYDEEAKGWKKHNDERDSVDYSDLYNILVNDEIMNYQYTQEDVEKAEEKAKAIENQIKFIEDDTTRKAIGSQLISNVKELDLSSLSKDQLKEIEKDLASISDVTIRNKVSAGITAALKQQSEAIREKNEEWAKKTVKQITTDSIQDMLSDTELDKKYFDLYDKLLWKSEETTDAQKLASAENLRGAQAMKKLVKAYEENEEAFSKPSNIEGYTEALLSLQEGLKLLFNTDEDIDSGFIVQHFDLIQKAINGDIQSLKELRYLMSLSQVETLELDKDLEIIIKNALEKIYNGSYELGDNVIDALGQSTVNAIRSAVSQAKISAAELSNIFQNVNLSLVGDGQRNIDFNASSFFNYKPTYKKAELDDSKKNKKKLEDEKERYHEITKSIESQTRELDRLSKAKDRAWGSQRLSLMDAERNALEKELELQKQLLKETESYYDADKKKMASWGAKFDDNGNISNYDELMTHYVNQYNANSDSESVAEKYEDFKNDLDQYEETLEKLEDQQQVIIDKQNEIIDLALEKVQYKVEYQIEIDESEIEILEYFIEKAESGGIDKAADKIAKLTQKTGIYKDQMDLYAQAVREVFEISEYDVDVLFAAAANGGQGLAQLLQGGTLTEEQIHALQEYQSSLIETNQALDEMANTINETIVSALGEMNEKFEDYLNKLEHLQSLSESYNNIIDIIGKDTLGISNAALRQMSQAQMENANGALSISKDQLEAAEQAYEQVKALYEQDPEMFRDAMKEAKASLQEAQSNFMERWETALTAAADAFKANVELIAEEFSSSVSGIYDSIEEMQGAFERQKEIGELYFQNYKKTYEISKLNRKISQDIEKSDNVKAKGELNKLAAEINAFNKDNKKMSEYDLGYLQKKYELLQAQFALEDAQNAKNQMTLRQDSEGNWGYVYTANQDDIDQKQQSYEDKLYEIEDFMYQSEQSLTKMYIQALADYENGIQELAEKYGKGSKKFQQEALKLQKHFTTLTGYSIAEIKKLTMNGSKLNEEYGTEVIDTYSNTILGQMNLSYQTFEQLQSSISQNIIRTTQEVTEAHRVLSENIESVMNEAGTSIEDFKDKYEKMYNSVSNETEMLKDEVSGPDGLKEKVCKAFNDMMIEVNKWYDSYGARIPQLQKQNLDIITSIEGIIAKYGELDTRIQESVSKAEEATRKMQQLVDTDPDDDDPLKTPDENATTGNTTYTIVGATGNELTVKDSSGKTHILKTNNVIRGLPTKREGYSYEDLNELFDLVSPFTTNISGNTNNVDNNNNNNIKKTSSYSLKNIKDPPRGGYTLTEGYYDDGKKMGLKGYDYKTSGNDIDELRKLSIIGYRKHPDGDIMYRLNRGVALGPQDLVFYWLNQTTLHSLLDISGQTALYKQINLAAYNTGGYTGEWGPEGRLAMLHQKEIVLNASDTENLLRTIDMVRSFNDRIEQSARMTALGLSNIGGITSRIQGGDTLQQEVTIHAEFPNVTDHNEIELALGNLVNDASQYANRK